MNIFFFGDSICSGQGISIHRGWAPRISSDIENLASRYKNSVTVINSSVNGDTTRSALERMPYAVQSHGIDMIIIQFGMNDCNYWKTDRGIPRVSPQSFQANLEEIVDRAKTFGAKKIHINTNHPTTKIKKYSYASFSYNDSNRQYNKLIRKMAKGRKDIILNDIEKYFLFHLSSHKLNLSEVVLKDSVHLSQQGHELYYKFLSPSILHSLKTLLNRRK